MIAAYFLVSSEYDYALICVAVGAVMYIVQEKRAIGIFSFTTPTHSLEFQSRQLDAITSERILALVRAQKPSAAPEKTTVRGGLVNVLVVQPFVQFKDTFASNTFIDAKNLFVSDMDPETRAASRLQSRMFSLWLGTMCGMGPLATGLAAALAYRSATAFIAGWLLTWIPGLILFTRLMVPFARFSGMKLKR